MSTISIIAVAAFVIVIMLAAVALLALQQGDAKEDFGTFSSRHLLNRSELKVLADLDRILPDTIAKGVRIFSQVSYGEFLKGDSHAAHARINQKRADFVIMGPEGKVLCVVEYQGAGHYGRGEKSRTNAEYRDRVKRAACASAGIPFVEIPQKFDIDFVRDQLVSVLDGGKEDDPTSAS